VDASLAAFNVRLTAISKSRTNIELFANAIRWSERLRVGLAACA